mgnify:CR=1 FL=1
MHRLPHSHTCRIASLAIVAAMGSLALPARAADGNLDPTFSGDGKALFDIIDGQFNETGYYVRGLPDGAAIVAGHVASRQALLKVRANGTLDTAFGVNGWALDLFGSYLSLAGLDIAGDGKILVVGSDYATQITAIARLLADGTPDPDFGAGGIVEITDAPVTGSAYFVAQGATLDSAGRLLVAGYCRSNPCTGLGSMITRRDAEGDPDPEFGSAGWAAFNPSLSNNVISCPGAWSCLDNPIEADSDGGLFYGGALSLEILRVDAFGDADSTFGGDGLVELNLAFVGIEALEHDPVSGALYVAMISGALANGDMATGVARLLPNGELDTQYGFLGLSNLTLGSGSWILDLELQSDGKLLAVGVLDATGVEEGQFLLARLDSDGLLDPTFDGNGWATYDFDLTASGRDIANAVALVGGRAVAVGVAENNNSSSGGAVAVVRTQSTLIFTDGFERHSLSAWR